jgi:Ran GTPase-activating protein (RanGAP) involved in mRNA processing and transport
MGNDGAAALAAWLPHSGPLCMLDLSFNSITAAGAVALAKALPSCASLARLDITGNFIEDIGQSAIMQHAPVRIALKW